MVAISPIRGAVRGLSAEASTQRPTKVRQSVDAVWMPAADSWKWRPAALTAITARQIPSEAGMENSTERRRNPGR